jgi:hypothetical protein
MIEQDGVDSEWSRIPLPIESEDDRRTLCAVLASVGLAVRIVRFRNTPKGVFKKYIEYRDEEKRGSA